MKWSVRDESLHSKMGCQLFRHMCSQIPGLKQECEPHIFEAALTMHNAEMTYISKIFEMGDIDGITKYDLCHFIKKRVGDKLAELGYTTKKYQEKDGPLRDFTFYDQTKPFYQLIFLLYVRQIIVKQTRVKTLKIFGNE